MGARIQAERIVFLVVAQGVVTLLPELPKRAPCPVSFPRSALLPDDQQYGTSPRGSASGARLTNRRIESRPVTGTRSRHEITAGPAR